MVTGQLQKFLSIKLKTPSTLTVSQQNQANCCITTCQEKAKSLTKRRVVHS